MDNSQRIDIPVLQQLIDWEIVMGGIKAKINRRQSESRMPEIIDQKGLNFRKHTAIEGG